MSHYPQGRSNRESLMQVLLSPKILIDLSICLIFSIPLTTLGQEENSEDGSSIKYGAEFFSQYSPVNVNDMIDRIPGINLAMNGRGG